MNRPFRNLILAATVAAAATAPVASASAHDWHRHHHHGDVAGAAIGAGILGVAVGALIANSANPAGVDDGYYRDGVRAGDRVYIDEPARYPRVVTYEDDYYGAAPQPWSRAWFRYCEQRYRTFDPESGTFIGNDGRSHFCIAGQ